MPLFACRAPANTSEIFALDTVCTQQVYGSQSDSAIAEVNDMLNRISHEYVVGGELISSINSAAPVQVKISDEAAKLVRVSLAMANMTEGAFDPTIGPVSALWDISGEPRVPSPQNVKEAAKLVDYKNISITGNNVALEKKGMGLDLGGIAKGFAADIAVQIYKKYGIKSALINLGGNIYALGNRADGQSWRIGIRDPNGKAGEYAAVVPVTNKSVVTSGSYERFFESEGKTYHHIFDPHTGYPAQTGVIAVTVISENSTMADALSTALFVMGIKDGIDLVERTDDVEAIFFTQANEVYVSKGLQNSIEITNETYTIKS